jgi:hypothetical protein
MSACATAGQRLAQSWTLRHMMAQIGIHDATCVPAQDVLRIAPAAQSSEREAPLGVDSLNVSVATGILLHHLLTAVAPA